MPDLIPKEPVETFKLTDEHKAFYKNFKRVNDVSRMISFHLYKYLVDVLGAVLHCLSFRVEVVREPKPPLVGLQSIFWTTCPVEHILANGVHSLEPVPDGIVKVAKLILEVWDLEI